MQFCVLVRQLVSIPANVTRKCVERFKTYKGMRLLVYPTVKKLTIRPVYDYYMCVNCSGPSWPKCITAKKQEMLQYETDMFYLSVKFR